MCKIASFIGTRHGDEVRVYWSRHTESHEGICEEHNIRAQAADGLPLRIVKLEVCPPYKDLTRPLEAWAYGVDGEAPDWYAEVAERLEAATRAALREWAAAKLFTTGSHDVGAGQVYVAGAAVVTQSIREGETGTQEVYASGTGTQVVYGSGTGRQEVSYSGTGRQVVYDSGTGTQEVYDSGTGRQVVYASGTGRQVVYASGTGRQEVSASGTGTQEVYDSGTGRQVVYDSGTGTQVVYDSGTGTQVVYDSGTGRQEVYDSGTGTQLTGHIDEN